MKEPQWLLRETVLALQERLLAEFGGLRGQSNGHPKGWTPNERLLAEFGGLRGLRDAGLLDSALAR